MGTKAKTVGGLTASQLTKNKNGRVVSKKRSLFAKKNPWMAAVKKARIALKPRASAPSRRALTSTRRPRKSTPNDKSHFLPGRFRSSTAAHEKASVRGVGMSTSFEHHCFGLQS